MVRHQMLLLTAVSARTTPLETSKPFGQKTVQEDQDHPVDLKHHKNVSLAGHMSLPPARNLSDNCDLAQISVTLLKRVSISDGPLLPSMRNCHVLLSRTCGRVRPGRLIECAGPDLPKWWEIIVLHEGPKPSAVSRRLPVGTRSPSCRRP